MSGFEMAEFAEMARLGAELDRVLFEAGVPADQQRRADLGRRGENRMRDTLERAGWTVLTVPWHRPGSHGPDAIAYKMGHRRPRLLILDNKARTRGGKVDSVSSLTAPQLAQHLPGFIQELALRGATPPAVLDLLRQTQSMARDTAYGRRAGRKRRWIPKPPPDVKLMVTNAGGKATGVDPDLARSGIRFGDIERMRKRQLNRNRRLARARPVATSGR